MNDDKEKLTILMCPDCGLHFGFAEKLSDTWRSSHKKFFCLNGHSLSWPSPTPQEKELENLRREVKELQGKEKAALDKVVEHAKKIEEINLELEIWKPSEKSA